MRERAGKRAGSRSVARRWYRRPSRLLPAVALAALAATATYAFVSPVLPALLIRAVFTKGADATVAEMLPWVPDTGFTSRTDLSYGDGGDDTTFDVYSASGDGPLPTVVWIHGGAWLSGEKRDVAPYLKILASHGYTVIGLNYTDAPGAVYPTAVRQLNDALAHVVQHADDLRVDPGRIVLAGDSAGSQLASQLAAMATNPSFAEEVGIAPALSPRQLRGVLLNCGVYDLDSLAKDVSGLTGWGFKTALWAYTGDRNWSETAAGTQMSTIRFATASFPPAFISGGNGDPLTDAQSRPFAERLRTLGVSLTELFWQKDHEPALPHEYQFHLDFDEAHTALDATLEFLSGVTEP